MSLRLLINQVRSFGMVLVVFFYNYDYDYDYVGNILVLLTYEACYIYYFCCLM